MTDKSLSEKAVEIKGKKYVLVSDRILFFNDAYPFGSIETELVSEPAAQHIVVKATVRPGVSVPGNEEDDLQMAARVFTGHSQAVIGEGMVNKTAALENAETSAVGRALAMMGIGVIDSVASVDELNKKGVQEQTEEAFTGDDFKI